MATWNFLVDIWLQEEVATQAPAWTFSNQAPYLQDIQNIVQPTINVPEIAEQEIDLASLGLQNMEEFQMMVEIKEQWWSSDDFRDILSQVRSDKVESVKIEEPTDIEWFDIWVTAWQAISETAKWFKFQSEVDDNIVESGLKFLGNLPANTVQIAWDLISVASNPVWTFKSIQTLSDSLVQSGLNKLFLDEWEEVFSSEEAKELSWVLSQELNKIANEPWRIKELLVENPADVLLAVTWGLSIAKNVAKSKNLTWLAAKLETAERLTNPIRIQAEALKWLWIWVKKWAAWLSEKLIDTTLKLKPSDIKRIKKALPANQSPSKFLIEKGIIDDVKALDWQEGIVNKLQEFNTDSFNKLNDAVKSAKWVFKSDEVSAWLKALSDEFEWVAWMEKKFNEIQTLITKADTTWLTLRETLQVKREIDNALNLFKITWDLKAWATKQWLGNIRSWIRTFIEEEARRQNLPDIKNLSNDVRISRGIKDALVDRLETSGKNRIIWLSDIVVWGWAFAWTDLWTTIAILVGKKIIESPAFKIAATKTLWLPKKIVNKLDDLKSLTKQEGLSVSNAVKEYATSRWASIVDDIADKVWARSKFIDESTQFDLLKKWDIKQSKAIAAEQKALKAEKAFTKAEKAEQKILREWVLEEKGLGKVKATKSAVKKIDPDRKLIDLPTEDSWFRFTNSIWEEFWSRSSVFSRKKEFWRMQPKNIFKKDDLIEIIDDLFIDLWNVNFLLAQVKKLKNILPEDAAKLTGWAVQKKKIQSQIAWLRKAVDEFSKSELIAGQIKNSKIAFRWWTKRYNEFLAEKFWQGAWGDLAWPWVYMSTNFDVAKWYADFASNVSWDKWIIMRVLIPKDMNIATYVWSQTEEGIKAAANAARAQWFKWLRYPTSQLKRHKWATRWAVDYVIFDPKDAKIISDLAQDRFWVIIWRWMMENILKWWVIIWGLATWWWIAVAWAELFSK